MGRTLTRAGLLAFALASLVGFGLTHERGARACSGRPFDFDTYEAENTAATYGKAIALAVEGKAITFAYSLASGDAVDLRYQGLKSGPRPARLPESPSLRIPPSVYNSIAWIEANWSNGSGTVPFGGVGPVLRSFDCGYGLGQVTSGMSNVTGSPTGKQALIGTHFLFNIAEGVRILADKWNSAPKYRPIAGNGDPAALEDWYFAIWSYNGFAFSNHPLNPNRNPLRGGSESPIYHCYDPSAPSFQDAGGFPKFGYGDYTYPERVYGCMRYPPAAKSGQTAASTMAQTMENVGIRFQVGDAVVVTGTGDGLNVRSSPAVSPDNKIATLLDGAELTITDGPTAADGYTWWKVRTGPTEGWAVEKFLAKKTAAAPSPGATPSPSPTATFPRSPTTPPPLPAGPRIWTPQAFLMPDFTIEKVASAFRPENFAACEDAGFSTGCPSMDYPTTIPEVGIVTHADSSPPANPTLAAGLLGEPNLSFTGPAAMALSAASDGTASSGTVIVRNAGTWIAPYRVRTSDPWIVVRHPGDSASRVVDGGVAVGHETDVVTQAPRPDRPRIAQEGYDSTLIVTLAPALMPPGSHAGKVWIEPLVGGGGVYQIAITATNNSAGPLLPNRVVVPALSVDP